MSYAKCALCKKKYVPEVLLTTIDPPSDLTTIGNGTLMEAHVCRYRKTHGDSRPSIISEAIPFAQYDIHRQLMYKLRIYGLNAVFGLKIQFSVGESMMTAVATGTACYVRALPAPPPLKVFRNLDVVDDEDQKLFEIQQGIMARSEENRCKIEMALALVETESVAEQASLTSSMDPDSLLAPDAAIAEMDVDSESGSDSESDSDDEQEMTRRHRSIIVQIDDEQDEDLVLLQSPSFPPNFQICNTSISPSSDSLFTPSGLDTIQNITMIKHATISGVNHHPNRQLAGLFRLLYEEMVLQLGGYFERCVVAGLDYSVMVINECEIQIVVTGVAMGPLIQSVADDSEESILDVNDILDELRGASGNGSSSQLSLSMSRATDEGVRKVSSALPLFARELSKFSLGRELTKLSLGGSITSLDEEVKSAIEEEEELPGLVSGSLSGTPASTIPSTPLTANTPGTRPMTIPHFPTQTLPLDITPLWYIPSRPTHTHLGRISHHFVKESTMTFDTPQGGMGGFTHMFLYEIYAVLRAHARALGGNALVGLCVDLCVVEESLKGGTAYSLVSVGGDVVVVEETGAVVEGGFTSIGGK
ncbi:hypothetical protein PhCBS80983_g05201 [Powellomyces hirtus]|uniref:Uncharacterized protein n=1 Tax=Powellomyces hirtus TaxID=109895 RepID=A0A507DXA1_9FUNG|nr:hypothetical protein PhCBS80983_g05201 [Powellomyces hirtus]